MYMDPPNFLSLLIDGGATNSLYNLNGAKVYLLYPLGMLGKLYVMCLRNHGLGQKSEFFSGAKNVKKLIFWNLKFDKQFLKPYICWGLPV